MEPQDFQPDLGLPGICSILDGVVCYRRFALLTLKLEELAHVGELLFLAIVHVSEELQVIAFKESICKPNGLVSVKPNKCRCVAQNLSLKHLELILVLGVFITVLDPAFQHDELLHYPCESILHLERDERRRRLSL